MSLAKLGRLSEIGKKTEEVEVLGVTLTLQVLDTKRMIEAMKATSGLDELTRFTALRVEILSRAIIRDEKETLEDARKFVLGLEVPVMNEIMREYDRLEKEQNREVGIISGRIKPDVENQEQEGK